VVRTVMFRSAADAIAASSGGCGTSSSAYDHEVFARDCGSNSDMLRREAAEIALRRGLCSHWRCAQDQAVIERSMVCASEMRGREAAASD